MTLQKKTSKSLVSALIVSLHTRAFAISFLLTVELVADTKCKVLKESGVGQTEWNGTPYWDRTTFVIEPSGKLVKRYDKVTAEGHDQALLNDIKTLKSESAVSK